MKIDTHQHIWTEPLLEALAAREEFPFVRHEHGLTVLFLAGEQPYVIDVQAESFSARAALVEQDGLDRALVCPSSPLGFEVLPRRQALELIHAYHDGALGLGEPFGVWGAVPLDGPRAEDIEEALGRGCVGVSLPAGALAGVDAVNRLGPVLAHLESSGVTLFVHPGLGSSLPAGEVTLSDPLWWPSLTRYVAQMQAAWLSLVGAGRRAHPRLRIVFSMLAGLAPLHAERLAARGGPTVSGEPDRLVFYETSSYGPRAVSWLWDVVGREQLLYGSDRPLVDPDLEAVRGELDRDLLSDNAGRALSAGSTAQAMSR
jgi:hypothetical protein